MIRWGIIGCGDVTEVKSGPGFQKAENSALVAVMRRDAAKAADYARRHGVSRWYADADALIADPEVDAVYVATPPSSHCDLALRVASAGKPALVEKPMACSHCECRRMVAAFAAAGQPLFVAYYRRALPRFRKVKALLTEGAVGRVLAVSVTHRQRPPRFHPADLPWRLRPDIAGGGLFVDLGSHTLDLLDDLLGPIIDVAGRADRQGEGYVVEDAVVMSFVHESGATGCGSWLFNTACEADTVRIDGTGGTVHFSVFGADPVVLDTGTERMSFDIAHPVTIQQPFIQSVVNHLLRGSACPSTGETAARTNWVMDQVLRPYYRRCGWPKAAPT